MSASKIFFSSDVRTRDFERLHSRDRNASSLGLLTYSLIYENMEKMISIGLALGLALGIAPAAYAAGINLTTETSAEITGEVDIHSGSSSDSEVRAETDTGVKIDGVGITITRESASVNNDAAVTVSSPASVQTSSDLSLYASTIVKEDENVEDAELSEDAVSIRYKQRAKLFGVIPVFVSVKATVESSGDVSVSYPWYGFMLSQEERVTLESTLDAAIGTSTSTELSSNTQALILERMHATLKQNLEASLAAEANASVQ